MSDEETDASTAQRTLAAFETPTEETEMPGDRATSSPEQPANEAANRTTDASADTAPDGAGDTDTESDEPTGNPPSENSTEAAPLVAAYRHDVHKLRGRSHANAAATHTGLPVNETVPQNADAHAALLSRPRGDPDWTIDNHRSPYRLSLLTGESLQAAATAAGSDLGGLIEPTDPDRLHATWLTSALPAAYSEAMHYPYTSLKYHVLLVGAILANYQAGYDFEELCLVATQPEFDESENLNSTPTESGELETAATQLSVEQALACESVIPQRTVLWTPDVALHVTATPGDRPAARIGPRPRRAFGETWSRLSAHPLETASSRRARLLDAQLRRLQAWSTALQYIASFLAEYDATPPAAESKATITTHRGGLEDA